MDTEKRKRHNILFVRIISGFFLLFTGLLFFFLGKLTGGGEGYWVAAGIIVSLIYLQVLYSHADRYILQISGAHEADREGEIHTCMIRVSLMARVTNPELYIMEDSSLAAFSSCRITDGKRAAICVTRGLTERLSTAELEAVIAHELAHLEMGDTRLMVTVAAVAGLPVYLFENFVQSVSGKFSPENGNSTVAVLTVLTIPVWLMLIPLSAAIIQVCLSRNREMYADAMAAMVTKRPESLLRALEKISTDNRVMKNAYNATAHLFTMNPFMHKKMDIVFSGLFLTHPSIEERTDRLRSMV